MGLALLPEQGKIRPDKEQLEQELTEARRIIRVQAEELTQLAAWGQGAWRWLKTNGTQWARGYLTGPWPSEHKSGWLVARNAKFDRR